MNIRSLQSRFRGEVASLLTIISVIVIATGVLLGTQVDEITQPIKTDTSASTSSLTPIPKKQASRWFIGSSAGVCRAWYSCGTDPDIVKLELRATSGDVMVLDKDKFGRSPIGLNVSGACGSSSSEGLQVIFDPEQTYTNPGFINKFNIKKGDIVLSVRTRSGSSAGSFFNNTHYFIYERPAFALGSTPVTFYFEFDAKTAGVVERYSQEAYAKACPQERLTPTPVTDTPTPVTDTPTPVTDTPTPVTDTPTPVSETPTPITDTPTPVTDTPTPISTTPISTTPVLETPIPSPTPQACVFRSLAFVQECQDFDFKLGRCNLLAPGFMNAKALPLSTLNANPGIWGASNNKQIANRFPGQPKTAQAPVQLFKALDTNNKAEVDGLVTKFPLFTAPILQKYGLTYIAFEDFPAVPAGVDPLTPGSAIKIKSVVPPSTPQVNEQYNNFENASATMYFNNSEYAIVPDGRQVLSCTNVIKGQTKTAACTPIATSQLDTVDGLTVGCGQNIVYGWTVQKCNLDMDVVLVVDTSSSMFKYKDPFTGQPKLAEAQTTIKNFVNNLYAKPTNSRVAVVSFNKMAKQVLPFSSSVTDITNAINGLSTGEGTCIECGLNEAAKTLGARGNSKNKPVVIFLSDGLPNSYPGQVAPAGYNAFTEIGFARARVVESINERVDVVAIGYGDTSIDLSDPVDQIPLGQLFRQTIELIASGKEFAFSTDTNAAGKSLSDVFSTVQAKFNACQRAEEAFAEIRTNMDVNSDEIINTIDLLLVMSKHFERSSKTAKLREDINNDGIVNALDASLVISNLGTIIANESPQAGIAN